MFEISNITNNNLILNELNRLLANQIIDYKKGSQTQVINFMMIISHGTGFEILKITNDF